MKRLNSKDLVAILLILVVGGLIALGHNTVLNQVLLGIAIAYGAIQIPRAGKGGS